jgi:hypothetical protein
MMAGLVHFLSSLRWWQASVIVVKIMIILYFMNSKVAFFAYQNF